MDRRARYLDIALRLFLDHGFNGVSMDELVAEAGGSKATLYRYFDSKEALFEAIIDDIAAPAVGAEQPEDWSGVSIEEALRQLVRSTANAALDERTILMLRLALGEHARFPQLGRTLFEHGPARTYRHLRSFLASKVDAGEIEVDDLQITAEQLLGGVIGHQQLRMALGLRPPRPKELDARIEAAVASFLASHPVRAAADR